ncbi:MAG TPA: hypothetical protein VJ742_13160 [Nitrososphaera sp.]|nr:hypothetical protein [Nitrososphaera sp.]
MNERIIIEGAEIRKEVQVKGLDQPQVDRRDLVDFLIKMANTAVFQTGLLPHGVRMIRQAGDHMQLLVEQPPAVNLIIWGQRERDVNAKTYALAQPYRFIVADFVDGSLLGARMYYSPEPLNSIDQPLYHANIPNLNCRGYGGNSVGWLCLYHGEDYSGKDIAYKAFRAAQRCSGQEAYNNANMSQTDGTRFYQDRKPQNPELWDPVKWEKKSEAEGFEWTLQKDLWIAIKVPSVDNQEHHDDNGVQLTVEMAMTGFVLSYYSGRDPEPAKLANRVWRKQRLDPDPFYQKVVRRAFNESKKSKVSKETGLTAQVDKQVPCLRCNKETSLAQGKAINDEGIVCSTCVKYYGRCFSCYRTYPNNQLRKHSSKLTCPSCIPSAATA